MKRRWTWGLLPLLAAAPGVAVGCAVMRVQGVGASAILQNVAALLVGGVGAWLYAAAPRGGRAWSRHAGMLLCAGLLLCTFLDAGLQGVHRWIRLGPLALNAAFLAVPAALIGLDRRMREGRTYEACAWGVAVGALLLLQPDASMASALALAAVPVLLQGQKNRAARWVALCALFALTVASWLRPDPLEPVAHVEGMLSLAWTCGPGYGLLSLLSLAILFIPFALGARRQPVRALCAGNALLFAGLLLSTRFGAFPVPVLGGGASPILGYLLAAAHAVRRMRAD